jgi:hypothetical protein
MQQHIFTDGIGKITVIGGVVRLDFMVYSPTDTDAHGQPRQIFTHQVLMGVDAFTRASAQCIEAVKQIQAASQPAAAAPPAPRPAAIPPAPRPVPAPAPTAVSAPPRKAEASPWTASLKPVAPAQPFP